MTKDIQTIINRAEKEKKENANFKRAQKMKEEKEMRKKPNSKYSPESFRVYHAFRVLPMRTFWYFVFGLGIALLLFWQIDFFRLPAIFLLSAFLCRLLFGFLYELITYLHFRSWRKNLPFQVEGWEKLVEAEHFLIPFYWRLDAKVTLEIRPEAKIDPKLVHSLLFLFCQQANKQFYKPEQAISGFASDPRQQWKVSGNSACGSLNNQVVKAFYFFLDRELAPLNHKHNYFSRVIFDVSAEEFEIEPERYNGGIAS